jgi:hypothetical protein
MHRSQHRSTTKGNMKLKIYSTLLTVVAVPSIGALVASYYDKGWLTFQTAANLATVAGVLIASATLISIAFQQHEQGKLARANNSQSFVAVSSDFVLKIAGDEALADLWLLQGASYETLAPVKQAQYRYLVQWWLNFYENIQFQEDAGLLEAGVYHAWQKDMSGFVERRHVEKVWHLVRENYSETFTRRMDPLIEIRRKSLTSNPIAHEPNIDSAASVKNSSSNPR